MRMRITWIAILVVCSTSPVAAQASSFGRLRPAIASSPAAPAVPTFAISRPLSSLGHHLAVGFTVGFAVGALSGLASSDCAGSGSGSCKDSVIGIGIVGGLVGTVAGGIVYVVRRAA